MRTYKTIFTLALLTTVTFLATAQQAEKTFVKSFNMQGMDMVEIDLQGNVEVQEWNNKIMRVQMTVVLPNKSNSILKSLATAGRYNLKSKMGKTALNIYAPGMHRQVRIKGQELVEKFSYTIYVPRDTQVTIKDEASAHADTVSAME